MGGLGGFVSFVVAVLNVVATRHSLRGGWSHSPPVGKGGNVHDSVSCVWVVGMGVFFVLIGFLMTSLSWWGVGTDVAFRACSLTCRGR